MVAFVTVRDRINALGYQYPSKHVAWAIGAAVRERWLRNPMSGGELPDKDLRGKTSGHGSHCFAIYPWEFASEIDEVIHAALDSPQQWFPWAQ